MTAQTVPYEVFQREREKRLQAEQFIAWEDQLFAHQDLIPGVKLTMRELRRHPPKEAADKLSPAPIWRIAQNTGIGDKTTGKNISFLHDHKVLKRDERHDPETQKTQVSVQFLDPFDHPKKIDVPERPKSGYHPPKPTCLKCGDDLEIETAVLCPTCKKKHVVSNRPATEHDIALTEKFNDIVRMDEQLSEAPDNLSAAPTMEAPEEVSDNPITYRMPEEVSDAPDVPSTPPDVDLALDLETETAALLLEIAGDLTEPIEMVDWGTRKYTDIKKPLHLGNMREHIRGYHTYGTRLFRADGMTRALRYDADSPEHWQHCKEAARCLAIMDFVPVLEPSPAPEGCPGYHSGGGALWVLFDANVDAYSAKKTAEHYTGSLLIDIKEVWPPEQDTGNRARLPGGMYIMKDFKQRCKLYTVEGEEITRLVDHLTPESVIEAYTRPEPKPEQKPKPAPPTGGVLGKDLGKQIISEFNTMRDWTDIANLAGGFDRGKFLAVWRGDRKPTVSVNARTDLAKDWGEIGGPPMDKYDVYCKIMAHETGQDWQIFKKRDLAERCAYRRKQLEQQQRRAS
ncbi:MAG TPA: hypothetical protein VEL31_26610 [Ktedonobacteraceae bacterium]|nr:hypothetical protein [Ktedonobacteraceae bacterium]